MYVNFGIFSDLDLLQVYILSASTFIFFTDLCTHLWFYYSECIHIVDVASNEQFFGIGVVVGLFCLNLRLHIIAHSQLYSVAVCIEQTLWLLGADVLESDLLFVRMSYSYSVHYVSKH